nr:hypothetical protein [Tanacetum cinerariifolium]
METMIEQQVALDEALVPTTKDVPKIYMQEFWATAYVHQHSIRFKLDNKKHIVNMETFKDMLHICPRIPGQSFDELPFEEEILEFLRFLGHSAQIKTLTDVNINNLFQPWRSFGAVINKCLTGKSSGFDSFRLTAAAKGKQLAKAKSGDDDEESENDEESDDEETREEESFNPIPRTPKDSKDNGNDKEDLGFKDGEDEWLNEEEEADELYRDVDINQGRGLQLSQDIEDSHMTLTLVQPDGVESIFATASSLVAPLPKPTPTMTPSIITTIKTASHPPIPPTLIPSEVL